MAKRSGKSKESKKQERQRIRHERARKRNIRIALVLVVLVLGTVAFMLLGPQKQYLQCIDPNIPLAEHTHTMLFIGLGNQTDFSSQFIRVPDSMGISGQCAWPVHTHTGERTQHYVKVHVESPDVHQFYLSDVFYVWGYWSGLKAPVSFSNDGVSTYRGHVSVYVYPSDYPADSLPMPQDPNYLWSGSVRQVPLNDATWLYVHVEWPYTNTTSGT